MLKTNFTIKADPAAQQTISNILGRETKAIIYLIPVSGQQGKVRDAIAESGAKEFKGLSNHIYIAALVTTDQAQNLADCPSVSAIVNKRGDQPNPAKPQ